MAISLNQYTKTFIASYKALLAAFDEFIKSEDALQKQPSELSSYIQQAKLQFDANKQKEAVYTGLEATMGARREEKDEVEQLKADIDDDVIQQQLDQQAEKIAATGKMFPWILDEFAFDTKHLVDLGVNVTSFNKYIDKLAAVIKRKEEWNRARANFDLALGEEKSEENITAVKKILKDENYETLKISLGDLEVKGVVSKFHRSLYLSYDIVAQTKLTRLESLNVKENSKTDSESPSTSSIKFDFDFDSESTPTVKKSSYRRKYEKGELHLNDLESLVAREDVKQAHFKSLLPPCVVESPEMAGVRIKGSGLFSPNTLGKLQDIEKAFKKAEVTKKPLDSVKLNRLFKKANITLTPETIEKLSQNGQPEGQAGQAQDVQPAKAASSAWKVVIG